eukprot:scaffold541_cov335-Pavlova_lutheri.AAC.7
MGISCGCRRASQREDWTIAAWPSSTRPCGNGLEDLPDHQWIGTIPGLTRMLTIVLVALKITIVTLLG